MPNDNLNEDDEFKDFLEELEDYVKNPSEHHNYEMPDFTKPFTEEEKQAFEDQYTKATQAFNTKLPNNMKLEYDPEGFRNKINDSKQAEMYRRTFFVNEQKAKKFELFKQYKSEFAQKITKKELPLDRVVVMLMKTDGSEASDSFNRKLLSFYYDHPYEVSQAVLKGIMKADSTVYQGILKDDYERCKVFTDNFEKSYIAYEAKHVLDIMESDGDLTKELKNNPMIVFLQAQESLGAGFGSTDLFAMPKLTIEQLGALSVQSTPETAKYLNIVATNAFDTTFDKVKKEVELLNKTGVLDDEEPALSFKAIETKDGEEKEINLLSAMEKNDQNIKIVERSEEEKQNMLCITNGLKFKQSFMRAYSEKTANNLSIFDQTKILDNHKGGFFERLFNTTSKEYKEFVENFKKFTNPEKPDMSVKDKLIESAKAYLNHKNVNDVVDLAALEDGTGKERVKLCLSVLSALNVKQGGFKLIEDNPVVEEKTDNIVRVQVEGLEKDTDIEKSTIKKTNTNGKEKTKSIEADMTKTK